MKPLAVFVILILFNYSSAKNIVANYFSKRERTLLDIFARDYIDYNEAKDYEPKPEVTTRAPNVTLESDHELGRGINGGIGCATCTILFSIATQLTTIYNETLEESLQRICGYLPETHQGQCR